MHLEDQRRRLGEHSRRVEALDGDLHRQTVILTSPAECPLRLSYIRNRNSDTALALSGQRTTESPPCRRTHGVPPEAACFGKMHRRFSTISDDGWHFLEGGGPRAVDHALPKECHLNSFPTIVRY